MTDLNTMTLWRPCVPAELELGRASGWTRFEIDRAFARRYPVRQAGGETIVELWGPAEELEKFNRYLVGPIQVVGEHLASSPEEDDHGPV